MTVGGRAPGSAWLGNRWACVRMNTPAAANARDGDD